jgi:hypothetical protein
VAVAHPAPSLTLDSERTATLEGAPSPTAVFTLLGVAIVVVLSTLYALWEFWPTAPTLKAQSATPVHLFGITRNVSVEIRLFAVVALAGALGGLLHSTRSFAWYVGHSSLKWRWLPYEILTLFTGAGLATIIYVVIRGGIVSGKASTADINPYGFAAIGGIVGLFSEQALEMLRRVASDFFAEAPKGTDSLPDETTVTATTATATVTATATTDIPQLLAPGVETGDASAITANTVTLGGSVSPNGDTTTYHFDYGKTPAYGLSTADGELSGNDLVEVTVDLNDLTPGAEYHYRLVAANSVDIIEGLDATFNTAPL